MKSQNGTVTKTAAAMKSASGGARAVNGNKNISSRSTRTGSANTRVRGTIKSNLKGPFNAV